MPGVVFVIDVPTANFEQEILNELPPAIATHLQKFGGTNNLNINLPDSNAVLRLEVELRDKNARRHPPHRKKSPGLPGERNRGTSPGTTGAVRQPPTPQNPNSFFFPMEKVLEELLTKLDIEHVTWSSDKKSCYYTVIFPLQAGDPCETTLHCLTQLGIGIKPGSCVSVLPCSVSYDAIRETFYEDEPSVQEKETKWNNFVEGIKSKLTVKQVVDGVRSGGSLSFDYLMLIVTADSLAALGLIENNSPNITAAMLVSPLMGPVMAITFGAIISDYKLVKTGFITLWTGMFVSLVFGFIFGLICGATEMPWGFGDFPTEEMKGRGNSRSLWMALPWALTSGTGVALALLIGAAGPLIGVAISASVLPPVVNCGIFWALACIIQIYPNAKIPHIAGEPYTGNSSYKPLYTKNMPVEFMINGIVSGSLTIINVICIFITAIITLKIKEVAAPYVSSPDLRRFWETDIKTVRQSNRQSTIRRKYDRGGGKTTTTLDNILENDPANSTALEQAIKEATDDVTFQRVKRMSYSGGAANPATEITQRLHGLPMTSKTDGTTSATAIRNSKMNADLNVLDQLVSTLLERHQQSSPGASNNTHRESTKLSRLKSLSFRNRRNSSKRGSTSAANELNLFSGGGNGTAMPTILESSSSNVTSIKPTQQPQQSSTALNSSSLDRLQGSTGVRQIINSIKNAPHRLSQSIDHHRLNDDEETSNLTRNMLD